MWLVVTLMIILQTKEIKSTRVINVSTLLSKWSDMYSSFNPSRSLLSKWGIQRVTQGHEFSKSFQVIWTPAVEEKEGFIQRKHSAYMQYSCQLRLGLGRKGFNDFIQWLNNDLQISDRIFVHLFKKNQSFSKFQITSILCRGGHFLSHGILITKNSKV